MTREEIEEQIGFIISENLELERKVRIAEEANNILEKNREKLEELMLHYLR